MTHDEIVAGRTVIGDGVFSEAFSYVEGIVGPMIRDEPVLTARVSRTQHSSPEQKRLLKSASELLVGYLKLDGQDEVAEEYIGVMSERIPGFQHAVRE